MTNKTQHTPGPWTISDEVNADGDETGAYLINTLENQYVPLGDQWRGLAKTYTEANARLIASAPELLEALKELHKLDSATNGVETKRYDNAMNAARAAIAKAEGE